MKNILYIYIYTEFFNLLTCHLLNFDILTLSPFKETDERNNVINENWIIFQEDLHFPNHFNISKTQHYATIITILIINLPNSLTTYTSFYYLLRIESKFQPSSLKKKRNISRMEEKQLTTISYLNKKKKENKSY